MKNLFWVPLTLFMLALAAEESSVWMTDFARAKAAAAKNNAPILLIVYGPDWCARSKRLDRDLVKDKSFADFLTARKVTPLLVTLPSEKPGEKEQEIINLLTVYSGVPHVAILDSEGLELEKKCRPYQKVLISKLEEHCRIMKTAAAKKQAETERKAGKEKDKSAAAEERQKLREERKQKDSENRKSKKEKKDKSRKKDKRGQDSKDETAESKAESVSKE